MCYLQALKGSEFGRGFCERCKMRLAAFEVLFAYSSIIASATRLSGVVLDTVSWRDKLRVEDMSVYV